MRTTTIHTRTVARAIALASGLALLVMALGLSPAGAVTPPTLASDALRLDGGLIPGSILEDLWDEDDEVQTVELPFPINFFGTKAEALCVTTNGGVYPVPTSSGTCADEYDESVGDLAITSKAPMIAVLALDLDLSNPLILSDGRDADDLHGSISGIVRTGGVATVTTTSSHKLEVGDRVVLFDTGDPELERSASGTMRHHTVTTVLSDKNFTFAAVGDDSLTGGTYAFSDGRGAPRGMTWHETTIDGREAVLITWYRVPNYENENDRSLSNTFQLVLIKGQSGTEAGGFDFTVEFNYGSLRDDEDGYKASSPTSGCDAYQNLERLDTIDDCRWGVGWANYGLLTDLSITVEDGIGTLTTTSAHEIPLDTEVSRSGIRLNIGSNRYFARSTSATTLTFETTRDDAHYSGVATVDAADVYELFADTPMPQLIDGGAKALVSNRLNSTVPGRYVFDMAGGITTGFTVPELGAPDEPPTVSASPSPSWVAKDGVAPQLPRGVGEWVQQDGSSSLLAVSSPAANQVRYETDGIQVTFTGAAGTSVANGLVADANGEIVCEVCATLSTGGVIESWMFSTPRLVAAHRVEDLPCQRFAVPVVAPLDGGGPVTSGAHTLQLALPTASGMQAVNVGVTVGGPVPASVPAGEGPVPSGAAVLALLGAAGALVAGRRLVTAG